MTRRRISFIFIIFLLFIAGCDSFAFKSWDRGYEDGYEGATKKKGLFYGKEYQRGYDEGWHDAERYDQLENVLGHCNCNLSCASTYMGISLTSIEEMIDELGVECP